MTINERDAILTVIDNVLDVGARRIQTPITIGRTVAEILPERVTPESDWVVIENGKILEPHEWHHLITPGMEIICYPRMRNDFARIGIGAAFITLAILQPEFLAAYPAMGMFLGATGAGLAIGGVTNLLMGPPKNPSVPSLTSGDQGGSPTYGFGGIQNSTRIGAPIPVVYGTHKAFPVFRRE